MVVFVAAEAVTVDFVEEEPDNELVAEILVVAFALAREVVVFLVVLVSVVVLVVLVVAVVVTAYV